MKSQEAKGRGLHRVVLGAVPITMLLASGLSTAAGNPQDDPPPGSATQTFRFAKGRVLIQAKAGLTEKELDKLLKPHGGKRLRRVEGIDLHVIELPPNALEAAVAKALRGHPHVKFAELDEIVDPDMALNDPKVGTSWHLSKIKAPAAWDISSAFNVTIAVLDTGVDTTHPDLSSKLVPGWNVIDNNSVVADLHGHGTATAGVAAAAGNNALGGAGVAWGAKIMPVKIADGTGASSFSLIAQGITWAADHGAKVASISYRNLGNSSAVLSAAQYMRGKGGVVVVSAGNDGSLQTTTPSPYLTTVGATDANDARASFSNTGNFLDVVAPGVSVPTTLRGGNFGIGTGTSFSTPVVAGTYALMMSANSALAPVTLDGVLTSTSLDLGGVGFDTSFGWGRVDAYAAVSKARSTVASDTLAPSVAITSPASSSKLSGLVSVAVAANDNIGVTRVQLYAGGVLIATDTSSPYGFILDTTRLPDGATSLEARAFDAAGNSKSAFVSVIVANDTIPPTATISNPVSGVRATGTLSVNVSAEDNKKVARITLLIDGKEVAVSYGTSLAYAWAVPAPQGKKSSTTSNITARAYDAAGNMGSQSVTVYK